MQNSWRHSSPADARVEVSDVEHFLTTFGKLKTASTRADSIRVLNDGYITPGSSGLSSFVKARIGDASGLLQQIQKHPLYYEHLAVSLAGIQRTRSVIDSAFNRLEAIYPKARFSDVYLMVGRMNSGGTTSPGKLLIGSEMYGLDSTAPTSELNDWERMVLRDQRLIPTIVTHENIHLMQAHLWRSNLLKAALREGGADFIAELATGMNINSHVHAWAAPREAAIWKEFKSAMHEKAGPRWFGTKDGDRPADLGYYVGYRIAQAYYDRSSDKVKAIDDILAMRDADALLERSGYDGGAFDVR